MIYLKLTGPSVFPEKTTFEFLPLSFQFLGSLFIKVTFQLNFFQPAIKHLKRYNYIKLFHVSKISPNAAVSVLKYVKSSTSHYHYKKSK